MLLGIIALVIGMTFVPAASGQMMPAEDTTSERPAAADQPEKVAETAPSITHPDKFIKFVWGKYLGDESPYRGVILMVITLLVLTTIYRQSTRYVKKIVKHNAFTEANAEVFMKTWRIVWKFVIAVFTILALSGSLRLLGLSAGFLGMILGWSLQAPVTGLAAWFMIITKKPFRLGDRIVIAGYTGDVTDITLTHVVLNQVGGSVGGEERSGRGILIPNAILFSNVIINFTLDQKFMLDEVIVRLTFDSDIELAERVCVESVHEATAEIVKESGFEPGVRCELYESGVLMRVRYQTIPSDRQRISTDITRRILKRVRENYGAVKFCYPHSVVRYRNMDDDAAPPAIEASSSPD